MSVEMKDVDQKIGQVVTELRKEVEKVGEGNSQKLEKITAHMTELEQKNQELIANKTAKENQVRALEEKAEMTAEQLKTMEKVIARFPGSPLAKNISAYKETPQYKAFQAFAAKGDEAFLEDGLREEFKTLRTDVATDGGVLVPQGMTDFILKEVEEISPVEQFARVFTGGMKSIELPIRKTIPSASFQKELEEGDESNSKYRMELFTAFAQEFTTPMSRDIMKFANFDIEREVSQDAAIAFAQGANQAFLTGTGNKEP